MNNHTSEDDIEIHGGRISFESNLGVGSTFIVNQPLNNSRK